MVRTVPSDNGPYARVVASVVLDVTYRSPSAVMSSFLPVESTVDAQNAQRLVLDR